MTETLSLEQQHAFTRYRLGYNLFITGSGGTGKSYLIKTIKKDLVERGIKHAVCALTGCAAVLLNCYAKTIHSWSGIGIAAGSKEDIVNKAIRNKRAMSEWKTTKVLIVDEISMMSLKIFEAIDSIGKSARAQYMRPFGGMQVIFLGDFYQLPPVSRTEETRFCFESPVWKQTFTIENHIYLKTLYRQRDAKFIRILNEVRDGSLTEESLNDLNVRLNTKYDPTINNGIVPTKLFPRNIDADRVNQKMYAKLDGDEEKYDLEQVSNLVAYDETGIPIPHEIMQSCLALNHEDVETQMKLFCENSNLVQSLSLKKGAVVMCLANLDTDAGICNGSQGIVVDFKIVKSRLVPVVQFLNGITMTIAPRVYQHGDYPKYGIIQVPLRLAWAFTIHKSQGVTLDLGEVDIGSNIFEFGQTYVALSRIRSLEGLYLSSFNPRKIKTNPLVSEFYKTIPEITESVAAKTKETLDIFENRNGDIGGGSLAPSFSAVPSSINNNYTVGMPNAAGSPYKSVKVIKLDTNPQ